MSIEMLASKLPDVMGTYRHLSNFHTQFSVAWFLVSTLLSKIGLFDVGDRDLPIPTSGIID